MALLLRVIVYPLLQIWYSVQPPVNGTSNTTDVIAALFNMASSRANVTADFKDIPGMNATRYHLRDLWQHVNIGSEFGCPVKAYSLTFAFAPNMQRRASRTRPTWRRTAACSCG